MAATLDAGTSGSFRQGDLLGMLPVCWAALIINKHGHNYYYSQTYSHFKVPNVPHVHGFELEHQEGIDTATGTTYKTPHRELVGIKPTTFLPRGAN